MSVVVLPGAGPGRLAVIASPEVAAAIAGIGRTEDVAVSPDGGTLAIAAFEANAIALVPFQVRADEGTFVALEACTMVTVDSLRRPHGLAFLSPETLLVANRESELLRVDLEVDPNTGGVIASGRVLVDGQAEVPVRTPGSVAVKALGEHLAEIVVCNNYAHDVTRYVLDMANDGEVIDAEILLRRDLEIPDGVALSASGEWIAVSNHVRNCIHLYRMTPELGPESSPDGVLVGVNYPHGLRFSANDRLILVADAGLPFVQSYSALDGDWSGRQRPSATGRVMDDETFNRGRYNPQEGGPKGLAVTSDGIVVVTSQEQPLAFFDPATLSSGVNPVDDGRGRVADVGGVAPQPFVGADAVVRRLATRLRQASHVAADASFAAAEAAADRRTVQEQLEREREAAHQASERADALDLELQTARTELERRSAQLDAIEQTALWTWRMRWLPLLQQIVKWKRRLTRPVAR